MASSSQGSSVNESFLFRTQISTSTGIRRQRSRSSQGYETVGLSSFPSLTATAEVREFGSGGTAFLSTPSIFFSLEGDLRAKCKLFDLDTKWEKDSGFVRYDFTEPEHLPEDARGSFDMVVIDPPFITREVWEKYAMAVRLLLRPGGAGAVLCSTISENASFMNELLGVTPCKFMPSIPNLVYQYQLFANYRSERLGVANPEIPIDDDA